MLLSEEEIPPSNGFNWFSQSKTIFALLYESDNFGAQSFPSRRWSNNNKDYVYMDAFLIAFRDRQDLEVQIHDFDL